MRFVKYHLLIIIVCLGACVPTLSQNTFLPMPTATIGPIPFTGKVGAPSSSSSPLSIASMSPSAQLLPSLSSQPISSSQVSDRLRDTIAKVETYLTCNDTFLDAQNAKIRIEKVYL